MYSSLSVGAPSGQELPLAGAFRGFVSVASSSRTVINHLPLDFPPHLPWKYLSVNE